MYTFMSYNVYLVVPIAYGQRWSRPYSFKGTCCASTRKGQPLGKIYALCNAYNATEKRVPGECTKY